MAKKERRKKEPKRKPKYGLFSCVKYLYQILWKYERSLTFSGILTVPFSLLLSALALYTSPTILKVLETSGRFSYIALVIFGILFAKLLLDVINHVISEKINRIINTLDLRLMYMTEIKRRNLDWNLEYEIDAREKIMRAGNSFVGIHLYRHFSSILSSVLEFLLFGTVVSMLHPLFFVLIIAGNILDYAVGTWRRRKTWEDKDAMEKVEQKSSYMTNYFGVSLEFAKDVRLYGMSEMLHDKAQALNKERRQIQRRWNRWNLWNSFISLLIVLIREGTVYAFLIYKAIAGDLSASEFILYFTAASSMAGFISTILGSWGEVNKAALAISDYREFMDLEGRLNHGKGIPVPQKPFSIEFRDVSYQYPEGEKKILDHISFKISAGEKIALVGLNGAGKTTLTMLMCGLLLPDEGEILLDGHSIYEYNRDEVYSLFGFVPQDYHVLPISIARNIACTLENEEIDCERLKHGLETAGLNEKINSLPLGADTQLNRAVNPDGIELSGGEMQKLLLARLLYHNPLCIILDEPTAALDPIAEDRIYQHYNEIAKNATSVFISHRLASTRFCDRIFLLDGASFAEVGTHDELMASGGKYRELFDLQSKYYKEGAADDGEE